MNWAVNRLEDGRQPLRWGEGGEQEDQTLKHYLHHSDIGTLDLEISLPGDNREYYIFITQHT